MTEEPRTMQCADFQAQLPELIGSGASASEHPHLKECALCRELLESLETIAAAARQLFPEVEPPDELWEKLQSAIKEDEGKQDEGGKEEAEMKTAGKGSRKG